MRWQNLDEVEVRERADGSALVILRDDRSPDDVMATKALSTIVAIARVAAGKLALEQKYGGRGAVVYMLKRAPELVVAAVTAAGGVVYDGTSERVAPAPLAATMQLDGAFVELASAVRRRLKARSFDTALELLEVDLRATPPERGARWITVVELMAVTGELMRENRGARWITAANQPLPLLLDVGAERLNLAKSAYAIVDAGAGTMRGLVEVVHVPGAVRATTGRPMPRLEPRSSGLVSLTPWSRLLPAEIEQDDLPVVTWIDDLGEQMRHPPGQGEPAPERIRRALANLAGERVELHEHRIGPHRMVIVAGRFASEKILDRDAMRLVAERVGAPQPAQLLVGIPVRGVLCAIDSPTALIDDELALTFHQRVVRAFEEAEPMERLTSALLVHAFDKPVGRYTTPLDLVPDVG